MFSKRIVFVLLFIALCSHIGSCGHLKKNPNFKIVRPGQNPYTVKQLLKIKVISYLR